MDFYQAKTRTVKLVPNRGYHPTAQVSIIYLGTPFSSLFSSSGTPPKILTIIFFLLDTDIDVRTLSLSLSKVPHSIYTLFTHNPMC